MAVAIGRGLRRRCPHCGRGPLYRGREHLASCDVCGLVFERNAGDTWAFTIIGDRLPVALAIAAIYFGIGRGHQVWMIAAFCVLGVLLFWTARNRWGMGIALHYLSRILWPDPADPIPASEERE